MLSHMADLCGLASAHVMTIWPSDLPALAVFLPRMPAVAGSVVRDGGFFRGDLQLNLGGGMVILKSQNRTK